VYLNRHAFNGLCRYNSSGEFNVPYGKYENPYFPAKEMKFFYNKACFCDFVYQDFEVTIDMAKKEDVVYCDPPFIPLSDTASFTHYFSGGFDLKQHERLVELAENSKCLFLISNHWIDITKELYKNADSLIEININRSISGRAESRGRVKEILAIYRPS
jgi:DNA adenine methylase